MKKRAAPKKILVVRNDKLGDFMLAWPSFAALKLAFPDALVTALVPNYTQPIAELCPWIDEVLIDPQQQGLKGSFELAKIFKANQFDLMLTLFSTTQVAFAGLLAGIANRWAPATKLAQYFYNFRLKQRRSRSEKPEYRYNLDLANACIASYGNSTPVSPSGPFLKFDSRTMEETRRAFVEHHSIPENCRLIFIHAGHGGSANNLSIQQYAELATLINRDNICFILTAGPGELAATQELASLLKQNGVDHRLYESKSGLADFSQHLALADLFIAGSTGTLHIAGALDRPTVGFYPNRRSATPLRWQTLNSEGNYLAITPPSEIEQDMSHVDLQKAAEKIRGFLDELAL
ncbi:MAG: glycosyltransferase family 9 protein [Motiliproteus sp.]|nr:glycosyltransferase family 9 protein [Motiliproteus sp.]MCW9053764.1 glycosyltransferase family 9 protein [Motiliproteus sp.]